MMIAFIHTQKSYNDIKDWSVIDGKQTYENTALKIHIEVYLDL
jgi:hypothetical protein